jgi:hypothetical protein
MIKEAGPLDTDCWLWTGGTTDTGYGKVLWKGEKYRVHRASWLAHRGPIPEGLHVLHRCDVGLCFNPNHLFLGTAQDNMDDKVAKGRRMGRPRLVTPGQAAKMAELRDQGHTYESIGAMFYVSDRTVRRYLNSRLPADMESVHVL